MTLLRLQAWLLCLGFWVVSHTAWAQKVLVQRPDSNDPVLTEGFNRLRAELRLSNFEVEVVPRDADNTPLTLRQTAGDRGAFAAVVLVRSESTTTVDIWISDRVTGKMVMQTLELQDVDDAPKVLALRAVDLLRSSLRDAEREETPSEVAFSEPQEISDTVRDFTKPQRALQLRFGGEASLTGPAGVALGPALGVGYRVSEFQLGLAFTGPSLGAEWRAEEGVVTFHQELLLLEARWEVLDVSPLGFSPTLGSGAYLLTARGETEPPLEGRTDNVFSFVVAPGMALRLDMVSDVFLDLSARAVILVPRPGLSLETEETLLARPMFTAAANLGVEL